ncbi:DNA polymerase III epsilon subunit [Bacillus phage Staley]|uniref:DNA polymerase III epsilon subunit n=1 Tax=Bacillus phage Staley TaxID=1406792 RepID=U5Q1C5_9CAUD|nr:DNA polymerase III epsilon subunit [Bacillus phage Staley]AGY48767.1 DNA polymerase III epsilon subunit [Bacillus phage Staley]
MVYSFIDLETTGLIPGADQIIQAALIRTDSEFNILGEFNFKVRLKKGKQLTPFIKELLKVEESDLKYGLKEDVAAYAMTDLLEDTIVVAQFATFDFGFLQKADPIFSANLGSFICTKTLNQYHYPDENSSLKPTCERLGIKLDNHHDAYYDIKATIEVLKHHKDQGHEILMNTMMKFPTREMNFVPRNATVIDTEGNPIN